MVARIAGHLIQLYQRKRITKLILLRNKGAYCHETMDHTADCCCGLVCPAGMDSAKAGNFNLSQKCLSGDR